MKIAGKQSLIITIPLLALLATFGLVTYHYEESGIAYDVDLENIGTNGVRIWGTVQLKVTNNRDGLVGFTDVTVELVHPVTEHVFYKYQDAGGYLRSGDSSIYTIEFDILIADLPDAVIDVVITGWLFWEGENTLQEKTIPIPIEVEI